MSEWINADDWNITIWTGLLIIVIIILNHYSIDSRGVYVVSVWLPSVDIDWKKKRRRNRNTIQLMIGMNQVDAKRNLMSWRNMKWWRRFIIIMRISEWFWIKITSSTPAWLRILFFSYIQLNQENNSTSHQVGSHHKNADDEDSQLMLIQLDTPKRDYLTAST